MSNSKLVVEAWTCWAIAVIFITIRISARLSKLGWRELKLDDGLMFCALFVYTAETTSSYYLVARWLGYSNSGMTDKERQTLDPNSLEWLYRVNGAKTHIWDWVTYVTLMWLLKACWIAYYARLLAAAEKRPLRRITVGYVVLGLTYLSAILAVLCKCLPLKKQWQIYPDPRNLCYPGNSTFQMAFIMSINTLTHMYIMVIPLPTILSTKGMLAFQKIFLLVVYSGGFLVTIFGILRFVSLLAALGTTTSAGEWSLRESFLAVLVTNLPIIAPIIKRYSQQVRSQSTKISSYRGTSSFNDSGDLELNDLKAHHNRSRSRGKRLSLISRIKEVGPREWDDDEVIMVPKPTRGRFGSRTESPAPSEDVRNEDMYRHTHTHVPKCYKENSSLSVSHLEGLKSLDLVPKKEKSHMRTTVEAGWGAGNHNRWNRNRENERGNGEGEGDVEEGTIRVVREFRFTNTAAAAFGGPVAG
ncbi:52f5a1d8-fb14-42b8-beed-1f8de37cee96 [Sclerotinia trifoliorum]|uniref:52f5a1d8-fb14-42b8-beed-1f8de37cee96 n=1 Tax=Sclerotinia trifoliorum TaxID=28548 RepID=A0A8H2W0A4_9HELO|nr:52f5a1d8-fb14-42b8-beed-1f8de37cee96 [Sclerotinia trifoliorum]